MKNSNLKLLILSLFLLPLSAFAYPDFIGYGYSSCITCHYSGLGGGALNDYGRALYATEITSRDIFANSKEEEEIGASSGFLGSKPLPWWIRPGIKYRGLWLKTDPGSQASMERFINMQNDVNLTLMADKKQRFILVSTISYTALENYYEKTNEWFAKEYYLRYKINNNLWFYLGQMDKAYGIRNVDHTAVNRRALTLGQFDQSQAAMLHVTYPDWDVAVQAFVGNAAQEEEERQKGFSVTGEYQVQDNLKVGASALSSKSDLTEWNLFGGTFRAGLSKGSAILGEVGIKKTKNIALNTDTTGSYAWLQSLINIRRGYNVLTAFEHSKSNISEPSPEVMKLSAGFLMFPLPRLELRTMATNTKTFTETSGMPDSWTLQGQVHVSY